MELSAYVKSSLREKRVVYKEMRTMDNMICMILYLILFAQLITEPVNRRVGKSKGYRYYMFRAIISLLIGFAGAVAVSILQKDMVRIVFIISSVACLGNFLAGCYYALLAVTSDRIE